MGLFCNSIEMIRVIRTRILKANMASKNGGVGIMLDVNLSSHQQT